MDFGRMIFLWGLLAVPLPLLLHLFFKRRKQRVKFSTLLFFLRRERYFAYRRRLLELLLLALRILAVLLLVFALSRMFFKRFTFIAGAKTEAVIVLDDSMSMQRRLASGGTAFDMALKKAEDILDSLSGDDNVALVFVSGKTGADLTGDKNTVLQQLRQSSVTAAAGSITAAVQSAIEQLRQAPGTNREIYLISDFQRTAAPSHPIALSELKNSRLFCLPLRGSDSNVSVELPPPGLAPVIVGRAVNIPFKLINHGQTDREVKVELEVDGVTIQSRNVIVASESAVSDAFSWPPQRSGRINGYVHIDDDSVALDNRAAFTCDVSGDVRAVMVHDGTPRDADPFFYLRHAIDPEQDRHLYGIAAITVPLERFSAASLKDATILFWAADGRLSASAASAIKEFLDTGGTLISLPRTPAAVPDFNALCSAYGFRLVNPYRQPEERSACGLRFLPPLAGFNEMLQLNLLKWRRMAPLNPGNSGRVLAESGGVALIVEQLIGCGRWIALGFDLRRGCSDWPLLKSFPVMAVALVNYAAGTRDVIVNLTCGGKMELKGKKIAFQDYAGHRGDLPVVNGMATWSETWLPGVTTFDGADVRAVVLRTSAPESDLRLADDSVIKDSFDASVTLLDPGEEIAGQVVALRQGTELTGLLLSLLLVVLTVEYLLGADGGMLRRAVKKIFSHDREAK